MDPQYIEQYVAIPQPPRDSFGFLQELSEPAPLCFDGQKGCDAGPCNQCLGNGVALELDTSKVPETAMASLRRLLQAKAIRESVEGYPIVFTEAPDFAHEEYQVDITSGKATIQTSDEDGFRRAIYWLEDRLKTAKGASVMPGCWRRKPFVKHRISRCFFGPTNRPPFCIDELMNDVDYYPENYLDRLAHEGINGLWLTMYFKDLPSSIFPGRGKDAPKRLAKLALTVQRCARYGIRIYVFFCEPKFFGSASYAVPMADAAQHPEVVGLKLESTGEVSGLFCLSTEAGRTYISESVTQLFQAVPGLGGIINIMLGEDNGSCINFIATGANVPEGHCPICSKRDYADLYRETAELFTTAMHKVNPNAEFIGWFYAPGQTDGTDYSKRLLHIAEKWPRNATIMFNFESGGASMQLGKMRRVYDYSLAYVGPSQLFASSTDVAQRVGAKLQVGCSHEDAAVPFIPVPENLYEKYRFMYEHGVSTAMQCWYFGNYPGLMNKAAGELSFTPFPCSAEEFLVALAEPDWGQDAPQVAKAWHLFSKAYRNFPSNLPFEWYGPLHSSIAWPLHLFPQDTPIAPSWLLKNYPEVSGDRVGECLSFLHTLPEGLELCRRMSDSWQQGMDMLAGLKDAYADNPPRSADLGLAEAIGLQMKSTVNMLHFYFLREDMLYERNNNLAQMKDIVLDEIKNTARMAQLCSADCRLGYHSEAEGYHFFPQKLQARLGLLQELLDVDFPKFDLTASWIDEYTGRKPTRKLAVVGKNRTSSDYTLSESMTWSGSYDDTSLCLTIHNGVGKLVKVDLSPCRMWNSLRIMVSAKGEIRYYNAIPGAPLPQCEARNNDLVLTIPLGVLEGFRRKGFPVLFNIHGEDFAWVPPQPWPCRLYHGDFNPNGMGWLKFDS